MLCAVVYSQHICEMLQIYTMYSETCATKPQRSPQLVSCEKSLGYYSKNVVFLERSLSTWTLCCSADVHHMKFFSRFDAGDFQILVTHGPGFFLSSPISGLKIAVNTWQWVGARILFLVGPSKISPGQNGGLQLCARMARWSGWLTHKRQHSSGNALAVSLVCTSP